MLIWAWIKRRRTSKIGKVGNVAAFNGGPHGDTSRLTLGEPSRPTAENSSTEGLNMVSAFGVLALIAVTAQLSILVALHVLPTKTKQFTTP